MKLRIDAVIALVLACAVVVWATYSGWPWYASAIAFVGFGAYSLLTLYEARAADAKYIAFVATLSAVAAVSRTAIQGVPGVQPATFFVILAGFCFGPSTGAAVGAFTAVGSDAFLGEGGWTPWQMLAWGLVGLSAGLLRHWKPNLRVRWLVPFGFVWGFLFGWITNAWALLSGASHVSAYAYALLCVQSFWFDLSHALATSIFLVIAGPAVFGILERFRRKLVIVRQ